MRPGVAIVIALTVIIAGCGGTVTGDQAPSTTPESPNVTAPGVSHAGITNPHRLADAHTASLENQSYTARSVITMTWPNGTPRGQMTRTLRMGPNHDQYVLIQHATGSFSGGQYPEEIRAWSNGNTTFLATSRGDQTLYSGYSIRLSSPLLPGNKAIRVYFQDLDQTHVKQITIDGWLAYQINATNQNNAADPTDDVHLMAVVDSFGHLYRFNASLPAHYINYGNIGSDRIQYSLSYSRVGRTPVERPTWVETAKQSSNTTYSTIS